MDEDGRTAGTRELRHPLDAPRVVLEGLVERRIEGHRCSAIDDDVDARDQGGVVAVPEAQARLRHVAGDRDDLLAGKCRPSIAVRACQRAEDPGREDFRLESGRGRYRRRAALARRPDRRMDASDLWCAAKKAFDDDFAQKACAARQQDVFAAQVSVNRWRHRDLRSGR